MGKNENRYHQQGNTLLQSEHIKAAFIVCFLSFNRIHRDPFPPNQYQPLLQESAIWQT